jgi:hypothetical protein
MNFQDEENRLRGEADEKLRLLQALGPKWDQVVHELARTRWKRLQHTQFVYWPERQGHPQILQPNDQRSYLYERYTSRLIDVGSDLFEALAVAEAEEFGCGEDEERVVYWKGWNLTIGDGPSLHVTAKFCSAWIYDDAAHQEPKGTFVGFVVDAHGKPRVHQANKTKLRVYDAGHPNIST